MIAKISELFLLIFRLLTTCAVVTTSDTVEACGGLQRSFSMRKVQPLSFKMKRGPAFLWLCMDVIAQMAFDFLC